MAILGTGVDLVHVPRIASVLTRQRSDRFARRILTVGEYLQWRKIQSQDLERRSRWLAVRWSVKEAFYKATYPHVTPNWKEVTYQGLVPNLKQKPVLQFHPSDGANIRKLGRIHVSVSHDGSYVYSSVLVEEPSGGEPN